MKRTETIDRNGGGDSMVDRVKTRVSLVVELIDDFNNRIITGSGIRVWIPGEKPPVRKPEGYYVFTNLSQAQAEVFIESGRYERQSISVDLSETDAAYTARKVRLVPGRAYVLPSGTTCVEGMAEPDSRIRMFSRESVKTLKLLYDYACGGEQEGKIGIYHPEDMDIEGKSLYIENRDKSNYEFFRISKGCKEGGGYVLSEPLKSDYKKIGTTIYPVHTANADEKGRFFLPILDIRENACEFFCEAEGNGKTARNYTLVKGTVNKVDLLKKDE
jgi:hypothetical protein